MLGDRLGVLVTDSFTRDGHAGQITIGSAGIMTATQPNVLLQQSSAIHAILKDHAELRGRRVWVLDGKGQVLAVTGELARPMNGCCPMWMHVSMTIGPDNRVWTVTRFARPWPETVLCAGVRRTGKRPWSPPRCRFSTATLLTVW